MIFFCFIIIIHISVDSDLAENDREIADPKELSNDPNRADNSYHVVTVSYTDPNTILDGFTITTGNADGSGDNDSGGGIFNVYSSPTVRNCTFIDNSAEYQGGGMFNAYSSPTVINCTFIGNSATRGGGMRNVALSNPTLTSCTFIGNSADYEGGGIFNLSSNPTVNNCTFIGNSAGFYGGGMHNYSSSLTMTGCTFTGNLAEYGGGMFNNGSDLTLTNCILWGNISSTDGNEISLGGYSIIDISYCDVRGGWPGLGNIDANPHFIESGHWEDTNNTPSDASDDVWINGDYHLKTEGWRWDSIRERWDYDTVTSRCIDAGNPGSPLGTELSVIPDDPDNLWGENIRINMGAYGGTAEASMPPHDWALLGDLTGSTFAIFEVIDG